MHNGKDKKENKQSGLLAGAYITMVWEWLDPGGILRIVAIGRKNWLFAGSDAGAERAAIIYSLIASCKLCEIDPFEYLRDVLDRVSTHPVSKIAELTPSGWKEHLTFPK